jgi:hypothetical protein
VDADASQANANLFGFERMVADDMNARDIAISPTGSLRASFSLHAPAVPRHVRWREAYRQDRYCRYLTQSELNRRIRDVLLNLILLTPKAQVGLLELNYDGSRWMKLWTDVLEEMSAARPVPCRIYGRYSEH